MTATPMLDTHVHFWDRSRSDLSWSWLDKAFTSERHRWTSDVHRPRRALDDVERFTTPDFIDETSGLGVAGLVHAHSATATDPAVETAWVERLAVQYGWPSAIIGRADLASPDGAALLHRHRVASRRCTSVRDMHGPAGLDVDACSAALDAAAELDMSVEVRTSPERFGVFVEFAERWPTVNFVLSHASLPLERTPSTLVAWRNATSQLVRYPNWHCKISALCGGSDPNWTVDSIRPWALTCLDMFGPDRCMLGSNWPIDRLFGSYADVISAYREVFDHLDRRDRERLFFGTAAGLYGVDVSDLDLGTGTH